MVATSARVPEATDRLRGADVVLIEDDASTALLFTFILEEYAGCNVQHFPGPADALGHLEVASCDLLITDVRLPGIDGIEVVRRVQGLRPNLPIVVSTAYASVEIAMEAVRSGAAAFIQKPISRDELLAQLEEVMTAAFPRRRHRSVLAVGAHPDDVELGVGGTLLRHAAEGDRVTIVTMSRGTVGGNPAIRAMEARDAAQRLGAELMLGNLEDTRIADGGDTVALIEAAVEKCSPDVVYTHSVHDVHQDHRSVHHASLVAARRVPSVYCFQSPSATVRFRPSKFVAVDNFVEAKLRLLAAHASQAEIRDYMAPDLISSTARYWGRFAGTTFAEPLEVERDRSLVEAAHAA